MLQRKPLKAADLLARTQMIKSSRGNFEALWQECGRYLLPRKSDIIESKSKGQNQLAYVFETSPIADAQELSILLHGILTNPTSKWFNIETEDPDLNTKDAVSRWLSESRDKMISKMYHPKARLTEALQEWYLDQVVFGAGGLQTDTSKDSDLVYMARNVKNLYVAENEHGLIDMVILSFKMTARAACEKWGDLLDEKICKAAIEKPFQEFEFEWHIFPRKERDKEKITPENLPIASIFVDVTHKAIIVEGGAYTPPIVVGRWEVTEGEVYGRSQGMIALPDVKQLNQMSRDLMRAGEKFLRPPLQVVHDMVLGRINLSAGALNMLKPNPITGTRGIEPINTVGNIPITVELIQRKEQNIQRAFFLDRTKTLADPRATLGQVQLVEMQKLRIMAPMLGRLLSEGLESLLSRTFDILFRKSFNTLSVDSEGRNTFELLDGAVFSELPEELKAGPALRITYQSPVTQAQQQAELSSINTWLTDILAVAQAYPQALDLVDIDQVIRKKFRILGLDPKLIKDSEQVAEIRAAKVQAQQAQQDKEDAIQLVDSASTAKKAGIGQ